MESIREQPVLLPTSIPPVLLNPAIAISIALAVVIAILVFSRDTSNIPHANPPSWSSPMALLQTDAITRGIDILYNAKKRFPESVFRMINVNGEMTVLPPRFANPIRNEKGLSFARMVAYDFHAHIPGFSPLGLLEHREQMVQNVARKPLTKLLNSITQPLASEATFACGVILGEPTDWKDTLILQSMLDLIARLSSRVFLGDKLCRNEDWLEVTKEYTVDAFGAAWQLQLVPSGMRYLYAIFSSDCRNVRAKMLRAQKLIQPVIDERRVVKEQARKTGNPIPKFNDAIEWGEEESKGVSYDPASFQLLLSFAAIHTTSDLMSKIMLLLATEPTLVDHLREEMVRVLNQYGWSKNALYHMKLLDSAMKEAQRLMPNERISMGRVATKDVYVKEEDFTIRKGQRIAVDATRYTDPTLYENPEKYDIYRWSRMRDTPEYASKAHFVSTAPEHLGFGHGMHACPGRFFAANEVKIALCYLLLKYDWELAPGTTAKQTDFGVNHGLDPKSTLRYKRREAEIDLDALSFEE